MDPDRFAEIKRACHAALEKAPDEREAYLDDICAGDSDLRAEIGSLLAEQASAVEFLETPAAREAGFGSRTAGTADEPALPKGTRLGPYEIDALAGTGGMGAVYRARDTRLERTVALKAIAGVASLAPNARERFLREARTIAALNHPHICAIHDMGSTIFGGSLVDYLVMEYLEGETLEHRLHGEHGDDKQEPLKVDEAIAYATQIAYALAAAHEAGIVHRDLKPANIMLTAGVAATHGSPQVKLLDFGLAKWQVPGAEATNASATVGANPSVTTPGLIVGTVGYMAPEHVRGLPSDHRADLFAFGCLLHEMLAGRRAFKGATPADTLSAILTESPPPVSGLRVEVAAPLQQIIDRCLEKRPEDRFASAHDLAVALEAIAIRGPSARRSASVLARVPSFVGSHRWVGVLCGLAVLALLVAAAWPRVRRFPGTTPAGPTTVLALPCTVYGASEVAFLADAVPQTISTLLAQVDGLETKEPPTSLEMDTLKADLSKLAEWYRVSSFIKTSVTASAGRLVLNVQLVDAATRTVRWAQQYEGSRDSYNELTQQAADGIRLAVRPTTKPVSPVTVSSEAEVAYREGTYFFNRFGALGQQQAFDASLASYLRALDAAPSFAAAAAKIAGLYLLRFEFEGDGRGGLENAESWVRRAFDIDPRCGEAWSARNWLRSWATRIEPEKALEDNLTGIGLAPRDAFAYVVLAERLGHPGSSSLFVAANLRAHDLDPIFQGPPAYAATRLAYLGRSTEALRVLDTALRVEPDAAWVDMLRAYVLLTLGQVDEADRVLRTCQARVTTYYLGAPLWRQISLAVAVARGDRGASDALAGQVVGSALDPRAKAEIILNAVFFAVGPLARMGRTDDAVRILLRSVEAGVPPPYDYVLRDRDIEPLRGDSRFAKVLIASRDGAAMVARVLTRARARGELPSYLRAPLDELRQLLGENGST